MATPKSNPDPDVIINEIHIAAPPQQVFQALIDPKQVVQWWGQKDLYACNTFELDLRPGGKWRCAGAGGNQGNFEVTGEILEVDPPRLLIYLWVSSWTGDVKTTVRWDLEPRNNGMLVRISHSGLAARPEVAQSYRGWPLILGWIRAFVEGGETIADRKAGPTR
jgi:uncharacterized protein YndB with AHSA1/START domain